MFRCLCDAIEGVKVIRTADATAWTIDNIAAAFQNWRVATVAIDGCSMWLFRRAEPLACALAIATCVMSTQLNTNTYATQALTQCIFVTIDQVCLG